MSLRQRMGRIELGDFTAQGVYALPGSLCEVILSGFMASSAPVAVPGGRLVIIRMRSMVSSPLDLSLRQRTICRACLASG